MRLLISHSYTIELYPNCWRGTSIEFGVMKMIIRSSHFYTMQHKIFDIRTNNIQIKDKLGKKFTIMNDQTLNNQTTVKVPVMDSTKNRDLLMQMLAINPQVVTTSDQFITAVSNNDQGNATREVAMPGIASPVNLTATEENSQIVLSWDSVSMALGYNVKRSTMAGGPYTIIANEISTNTYTDTAVNDGTMYYYVVTSVSECAESENSNEACATI